MYIFVYTFNIPFAYSVSLQTFSRPTEVYQCEVDC